MKNPFYYILLSSLLPASGLVTACSADEGPEIPSTRRERNLVKEGNKQYENKEFQKAEVSYRKALAENASSDVAKYNLASALSHMEGEQSKAQSDSIFSDIAKTSANIDASQRSFYNLGNNSFRGENYQQSIELYKEALRRNPLDDNARENLRLAQLKLQEQQQNQDQNQDKNQEQEQEQEQDQNQQQEQNQQNQDKQDEQNQQDQNQNQDQDKNQDQQGNKRPDNKENNKRDEKQGGMSQANAEQILKAMENEENATRRRVEAQQKAERERQAHRRNVDKPW
ncbi:MAG: hypothetical protein K2G40_08935 [Muribaculaceae bacterium]|nr:hypothetical protein [Muribaculaceae bacterium]